MPILSRKLFMSVPGLVLAAFLLLPGRSDAQSPPQNTAGVPPSVREKAPVRFSGDTLEYLEGQKILKARGNVRLSYKGVTLAADQLTCNLETGDITAQGHIILEETTSRIFGESMVYNLKSRKGTVETIRIASPPWYSQGRKIDKPSEKQIDVHGGFFSTCDLERPHYRLVAKKITLVLEDKIEAWDVLFYVGQTPILYLPYFSRSFKEDRPPLVVKAGRSDLAGYYVRTTYFYRYTRDLGGSVSLDYMTKKGFGEGLGFYVDNPDSMVSRLEGYHVAEKDTRMTRWSVQGSHDQRLTGQDRFLGSFQNYSDGAFDRDYQSSFINQQQRAYAALAHHERWGTASLSTELVRSWNPLLSDYQTSHETAPELSLRGMPHRLWDSFWYLSLSATLKRSRTAWFFPTGGYLLGDHVFEEDVTTRLQGGLPVTPFTQWNTGLTVAQNYRERPPLALYAGGGGSTLFQSGEGGFGGSLGTENDLTTRHSSILESRLAHQWGRGFIVSPLDPYQGLLVHRTDASLQMQPTPQVWANLSTGYDLRSLAPFPEQRLQLVTLDLTGHDPDTRLRVFSTTRFNYYWQDVAETRQGFGLSDEDGSWELELSTIYENRAIPPISYYDFPGPVPDWIPQYNLMSLHLGSQVTVPFLGKVIAGHYYDLVNGGMLAQEYTLIHPLHCWEAQLTYREAAQRTEVLFSLGLAAFPQQRMAFPTRTPSGH